MIKVFNLLKKQAVPSSKIDTSENITTWEVSGSKGSNDFPQQLLQNVYNSPAASAAIELWQEFTEGDGFVVEQNNEIKVSAKETLRDLHSSLSSDISSMWGCAILVSYSLDGRKKSFKHLPFESTRLGNLENGVTDRIYYNQYYGTADYEKKFTKWYYTYDPDPEKVKEQILTHKKLLEGKKVDFPYPGQVYWFSIERPLSRVYPQPFYYSAMSWFKIDADIQKYHSRNIDNNFLLSVLINKYGNPDTPAGEKNSDGDFVSTVGEEFNKNMGAFAGAENAGSVLVNWYEREEEKADISKFPINANDNLFQTLQNMVSDQISIGTKCPRILLGISTAGKLGDSQEIINAVKVMQSRTLRMREYLSRIYSIVLDNYSTVNKETDFSIRNINPFNILPEWVVSALSVDQKAKYISENFNIEMDEPIDAGNNEPKADVSPEEDIVDASQTA